MAHLSNDHKPTDVQGIKESPPPGANNFYFFLYALHFARRKTRARIRIIARRGAMAAIGNLLVEIAVFKIAGQL